MGATERLSITTVPMVTKIPADRRHFADHGWLRTYYLFSFADYYDPANVNFGTLRVFNDDVIAARSGFSEHDHANMEIVTIVLDGELTHGDNMGTGGTIRAGEVQYMSAGSGVTHSEMNRSDAPVHLYQIWLLPDVEDAEPRYAQKDFSSIPKANILLPVASGSFPPPAGGGVERSETEGSLNGTLEMRTDATIFLSELEMGRTIEHGLLTGRGAFIYVTEGRLDINGTDFMANDQARITHETSLRIKAREDSKFILIDVPIT